MPSHPTPRLIEVNFDGLVGPTHHYGGYSLGNLASAQHRGQIGNPKRAALQGLEKMKRVMDLGVMQAVLPPQVRPDLSLLRRVGFRGSEAETLAAAAKDDGWLERASSASAMWTANAATFTPSTDTIDGLAHLTPANLQHLLHRAIEAPQTTRLLQKIFSEPRHFVVHDPLPSNPCLGDEGAANHLRLASEGSTAHVFAWGRQTFAPTSPPAIHRFVARQTLQASQSVARINRIRPADVILCQQSPEGIDAGGFHTDVLAVGHNDFLMVHECAFINTTGVLTQLKRHLGKGFTHCLATRNELPLGDAITAYPFNSQILTLQDGGMVILAPLESKKLDTARSFLERVVREDNPITEVVYLEVDDSMRNGGGPACLRFRVQLTQEELEALGARIILTPTLHTRLIVWVEEHYLDHLTKTTLADPEQARRNRLALIELEGILGLEGAIVETHQRFIA